MKISLNPPAVLKTIVQVKQTLLQKLLGLGEGSLKLTTFGVRWGGWSALSGAILFEEGDSVGSEGGEPELAPQQLSSTFLMSLVR